MKSEASAALASIQCSTAQILRFACPMMMLACTQAATATAPRLSVTVSVQPDTVRLQRLTSPAGLAFRVTATVTNTGSEPVFISFCGHIADRQIGGEWVTVFPGDLCGGIEWRPLASGESFEREVLIYGFSEAGAGPRLDPRFAPGTYRLRVPLGTGPRFDSITRLSDNLAVSQSFHVAGDAH